MRLRLDGPAHCHHAAVWHDRGMTRARISTTVDSDLLDDARRITVGHTDSELIEAALTALLTRHRATEIDDAYAAAYDKHPLDEPDEWGDLESFRASAGAT